MMTRKDYVAIAEAFATTKPETADNVQAREARYQWKLVMTEIADVFADDNPRFDRDRFYTACEGK